MFCCLNYLNIFFDFYFVVKHRCWYNQIYELSKLIFYIYLNCLSTTIVNYLTILAAYKKKRMRKLKVTELNRMTVDEFKKAKRLHLTVVLDEVRSLYNVGSVFRSSDAFCIDKIYLCGITATPPHPEIHKTALGAEDSVDWIYKKNTMDAINELHKLGYTILAIEQVEGSIYLQDFIPMENQSYAIVFGNEVKGVQQEVVDACDGCIEIPQYGTKHSLNVSVTAGIVLWELSNKMRKETL